MFEKPSEFSEMSCEAAALLKQIAEPRPVGDSVKCAIARAAQRLHWENSRTKEIWYGRARRIDAAEMDALRAASRKAADAMERLLALRAALTQVDPHFHGPAIDALGCALRAMGCDVDVRPDHPRSDGGGNGEAETHNGKGKG